MKLISYVTGNQGSGPHDVIQNPEISVSYVPDNLVQIVKFVYVTFLTCISQYVKRKLDTEELEYAI